MRSIVKEKRRPTSLFEDALAAPDGRYVFETPARQVTPCRVCGDKSATEESEGLCWVCRRLKISAWRDSEMQMPMNE
ncbi:MAG: hypothetical protein GC160_15230 [Acidobacteria bacterium]|nr:hypothetical protein [Acidobacteriota bacterium]